MKRLLLSLLATLTAAALIPGCGRAPAAVSPTPEVVYVTPEAQPTPEIVYVTVTPEPTPAPPEETPLPPEEPETGAATYNPKIRRTETPEETGFPSGLDDDGRGPEEEEYYEPEEGAPGYMSGLIPVEFFSLDGDKQYEANLFLSNFAEQGINLYFFDLDMSQILPSLVDFAHIWYKINDRSAVSYGMLDGVSYEVISFGDIASVLARYISLNVTEEAVDHYYYPREHSFYQDGSFFFEAADGESYNYIAVADTLALLEDGRYCLTFTEYEVDLDVYFDSGIPRSYYELDAFEASQHPHLTRSRDGYAIVTPYNYNGKDTYQLVEYTTW